MDAVKVIQTLVAPVVMISACGLLCLAFYNRLSILVSRVRTFHHERLVLQEKAASTPAGDGTHRRLSVVDRQVTEILARARLIRNTLACLVCCISGMIMCSMCLWFSIFFESTVWTNVGVSLFVAGLGSMFLGMLFALAELTKSLTPVALERDFFLTSGPRNDPPPSDAVA